MDQASWRMVVWTATANLYMCIKRHTQQHTVHVCVKSSLCPGHCTKCSICMFKTLAAVHTTYTSDPW